MKGHPHPAWKKMERAFARWLGYDREPGSGGHRARGRTDKTGSDSTHPRLWIDCKHTKVTSKVQPQVVTRYMEVRDKARKESKTPVLVTKGLRMKGTLVTVHQDDLVDVAAERVQAIYAQHLQRDTPKTVAVAEMRGHDLHVVGKFVFGSQHYTFAIRAKGIKVDDNDIMEVRKVEVGTGFTVVK